MIRGYSGYYNGVYLRSSLEFAFAYLLDYKKIKWAYEVNAYNLDECIYIPDFYIYDDDYTLIEIIEIKGKENKEDGLKKISLLYEKFGVKVTLIEYSDILKLYNILMPISYTAAKNIFINNYSAVLNTCDMRGKNNPMYGVSHTDETKRKIGLKASERFKNPEYKAKVIKSMKNRTYRRGYMVSKREERKCLSCGTSFVVTEASNRKYCSLLCGSLSALTLATEKNIKNSKEFRSQLRSYVYDWASEHKEIILNAKYNKLTDLNDLFFKIESKFKVTDKRTITRAFGTDSRKVFLRILKDYVLDVR